MDGDLNDIGCEGSSFEEEYCAGDVSKSLAFNSVVVISNCV